MFAIQFTKKAFLAMALALLLASADAASLPGGFSKRSDGAIKLDFSIQRPDKVVVPSNDTQGLQAEKGDVKAFEQDLINRDVAYFTKLWLGSNSQEVQVDVDTGSSDLWVIDSESGIQGDYGVYDHKSSSSYSYVTSGFEIQYVDMSSASGNWVTDKVSLSPNGPSVDSLEFGDATTTNDLSSGILGIGYKKNEAASDKYSNLPIALKDSGAIKKVAYSLYLGDKGSDAGTVLFGGIDHAKYEGDLVKLPVQSDRDLSVTLNSIGGIDVGSAFTLDSGTTLSTLPPSILSELAQKIGATGQADGFYYWNDCDDAKPVTLSFNGVDITIPKEDITTPLQYSNGDPFPGCALAISPNAKYPILGDIFLRHAYIVYDLEDNVISMAPVKYSSDEDITVIS